MTINVFLSYAHEDESHRCALEKHLALLRRQGHIDLWHDRRILPGQRFDAVIDRALQRADIILLLISSDFLDSQYCYAIELEHALERERQGTACVIPVILRDCDWTSTRFAALTAAPRDALPVTRWPTADDAYADIARSVRRAVEALATRRSGGQPAPAAVAAPPRAARAFSERERMRFLRTAYAEIMREFAAQLCAVRERDATLAHEVVRSDAESSHCRLRRGGRLLRECAIWIAAERRCIAFAPARALRFDEGVCVDSDGSRLFLRALGLTDPVSAGRCLSPREAAQRFAALFAQALPA